MSHERKLCLSGLCLDLVKCYNTVHRERVSLLLRALGIPEPVIQIWFQSLQRLCRIWIVQGTCGMLTPTVNGIPEGDSFSVICMIALDFLWVRMVRSRCPDPHLSAYADNISWAATTAHDHQHVLAMTRSFCDGSGMSVDWLKTWCWGTSQDALDVLQAVLHSQIPATKIQHKRNAMDLGSQMTYMGPPQLGKVRKRLEKARARLSKLTTMDVPLRSKCQLALGGAFPVAFYGIGLTPLGQQHIDTLRSATATALFGPCRSRNSALALVATPCCLDPMEYILLTVLRTMRRFLLHLTSDETHMFLDIAARHDGQAHRCRGPASVLKYWLLKVGWIIDRSGFLHIQHGIQLHLVNSSLAALTKWVRRTWQKEVMDLHCSRSALRHLYFDFATTRQVIASFPQKQHASLIQELSGAFQTEHQKQTWAHDSDGLCKHCGQDDTRRHRLLDCPATQDIRSRYQEVVQYLQDEGSILTEMPAVPSQPDDDLLLMLNQLHPEADVEAHVLGRMLGLIGQGLTPEIYTDGSLQHSAATVGRFAAYGIIWDTTVLDTQRCQIADAWISCQIKPSNFATLACARTSGEQSIHRSELFAIVRTCELLPRAIIFSDSASALAVAYRCLETRHLAMLCSLQDFDLVTRLWRAVHKGSYAFHKVDSHVDPKECTSLLAAFRALGNQAADDLAVTTCWNLYPEVVQMAQQVHKIVEEDKRILKQLCHFHLELHTARAKMDQLKHQQEGVERAQPSRALSPLQLFQNWTIENPWIPRPNQLQQIHACAWGQGYATQLLTWMKQCTWPADANSVTDDPGISWHELYVSWVMFSKMLVPVRRPVAMPERLQPLHSLADVDLYQVTFSEQVSEFLILVTQLAKLVGYDVWPTDRRGSARSLYRLGCSLHHRAFHSRPTVPHQAETVQTMSTYVRSRQTFDVMPPLDVAPVPHEMCQQMLGLWERNRRRAGNAITAVKARRNQGQSLANFFNRMDNGWSDNCAGWVPFTWLDGRSFGMFHVDSPWLHPSGQGSGNRKRDAYRFDTILFKWAAS